MKQCNTHTQTHTHTHVTVSGWGVVKGRAGKRGSTVQGETSVLCYRNCNCDRNLVLEILEHKIRHTQTHTPGWTPLYQ